MRRLFEKRNFSKDCLGKGALEKMIEEILFLQRKVSSGNNTKVNVMKNRLA